MTVRELITALEAVPEDRKDLPVAYYDEFTWVTVKNVVSNWGKEYLDRNWDGEEKDFVALDDK